MLLTTPSAIPSANIHAERSMPTRRKGSMIASAELCLVSFITSARSTLTSISMRSAFDGRSASLPGKPSDAPGKAGKPSEHCGRASRQPFNCQRSLVPPSGDKSAEPAMEASASNRPWLSLGDKGGVCQRTNLEVTPSACTVRGCRAQPSHRQEATWIVRPRQVFPVSGRCNLGAIDPSRGCVCG